MLCYQALLSWELNADGTSGVPYSNDNPWDGAPTAKLPFASEWPDLSSLLPADKLSDASVGKDDVTPPGYDEKNKPKQGYVFGLNWTFSGYTNCCNSQIAALFLALGGKSFSIKDTAGKTTTYDPLDVSKPTSKVGYSTKKKMLTNQDVGSLKVFQHLFASVDNYYDADGKQKIWSVGADWPRAGMQAALEFLGLAVNVSDYATDDKLDEMKRKMRVGDHCSFPGHAWLCGEVRYEVTFDDSPGGKPEIWIDQSSFLRAADGEAIPIKVSKGKSRSANDETLGKLMTAADCELARRCEDDFLGRIDAFLGKDQPGASDRTLTVDGKARSVKKITVAQFRIFTANTCTATNGTWNGQAGEWVDGAFTRDDKLTEKFKARMGISRPFVLTGKSKSAQINQQISAARCYPTTSRPPQEKLAAPEDT